MDFLNVNIGLPLEDKEMAVEICSELDELGVYFETETFEKEGVYNINAGFDNAEEGRAFADKWDPRVYLETETIDTDATEPVTGQRGITEASEADIVSEYKKLEAEGFNPFEITIELAAEYNYTVEDIEAMVEESEKGSTTLPPFTGVDESVLRNHISKKGKDKEYYSYLGGLDANQILDLPNDIINDATDLRHFVLEYLSVPYEEAADVADLDEEFFEATSDLPAEEYSDLMSVATEAFSSAYDEKLNESIDEDDDGKDIDTVIDNFIEQYADGYTNPLSQSQISELKSIIKDEYDEEDFDISELTFQDVVEIAEASGIIEDDEGEDEEDEDLNESIDRDDDSWKTEVEDGEQWGGDDSYDYDEEDEDQDFQLDAIEAVSYHVQDYLSGSSLSMYLDGVKQDAEYVNPQSKKEVDDFVREQIEMFDKSYHEESEDTYESLKAEGFTDEEIEDLIGIAD